jgi:hypothetical protein
MVVSEVVDMQLFWQGGNVGMLPPICRNEYDVGRSGGKMRRNDL